MTSIFQNFWIAFILFGVINTVVVARKLGNRNDKTSENLQERRQILWWFGLLMIGPWIWMGCGILFGEADDVFSYFQPRRFGFWVRGFYAMIAIVYLLAVYWIFLGTGAATLVRYPEVINVEIFTKLGISGTSGVKITAAIALLAGSIAFITMWT